MKKTITILAIIFFVGVVAFQSGCHGPYQAKSSKEEALEHTESIVLMDKDLRKWLRIDRQKASYNENGRLMAYCEMRNRAEKNLVIQVQTIFKDERGLALDDMTNWETIVIPKNSIHYYKTTALTQEARKYGIRIKLSE